MCVCEIKKCVRGQAMKGWSWSIVAIRAEPWPSHEYTSLRTYRFFTQSEEDIHNRLKDGLAEGHAG